MSVAASQVMVEVQESPDPTAGTGSATPSLSSIALAFAVDYWDPSFRTPEEVESFLGSPVVAAIPRDGD